MARGRSSGVSLRYESTNRGHKFSKSKNFQLFFKTGFLHVSEVLDKFKRKIFFRFLSESPGIAMRSQRQKLPFTCNQRRRTLPVWIAWQGAGARVSHCDTRVPIEAINFLSQKIFNYFSKQVFFMFQDNEISFSDF